MEQVLEAEQRAAEWMRKTKRIPPGSIEDPPKTTHHCEGILSGLRQIVCHVFQGFSSQFGRGRGEIKPTKKRICLFCELERSLRPCLA